MLSTSPGFILVMCSSIVACVLKLQSSILRIFVYCVFFNFSNLWTVSLVVLIYAEECIAVMWLGFTSTILYIFLCLCGQRYSNINPCETIFWLEIYYFFHEYLKPGKVIPEVNGNWIKFSHILKVQKSHVYTFLLWQSCLKTGACNVLLTTLW